MVLAAMQPSAPTQAQMGAKNDPPLAPAGPYLHGPAGLFNRRELDNQVLSAFLSPMAGVANAIPVLNGARNLGNSDFGGADAAFDSYITGITAGDLDDFDNQPTTACADGPVGGLLKLCSLVNPFGNYKGGTREVEIVRAGRVADRCDNMTLQLMNSPIMEGLLGTPSMTPSLSNAIANELASRIYESVFSFWRMFAPRVWTGSPANNSGERRDIVGFNTHINAGNHVDALSSAVCTAVDSDIKDFGYDLVGGNGRNIMEYIEMADRYVMWNASRQGLGVPTYIIAMRPELWQELTEIIPIQKFQRVIAVTNLVTNGRAMIDASQAYNERNALRQTLMLPVNGRMIPVVVDDTIAEQTPNENANLLPGQYASDIYGIPLTVLGGFPVTYFEYFDHGNNNSDAIQQMAGGNLTFTTDGGMFRWFANFKNGCLKLNYQFSLRLRMRAPQVAWRIQSVAYEPLQHLRSWQPDNSYFFNGGITSGQTQTYYSAWSPSVPAQI